MLSLTQLTITVSIIALSQARRLFDQHLDKPGLEEVHTDANKRTDHPHSGVIYVMVRCPDGSNSKEVLSEYLPDTSIEAVAPMMQHWNDLAEEAMSDRRCKNSKKAKMSLVGFNNLREKRADGSKPGLVEWIAACSDASGADSKTALSVHVPDTSTEAIAHMSWLFDEYLEEARLHVGCADGNTATIKIRVT